MSSEAPQVTYVVGDVRIDPAAAEVWKNGESLHLEPRAFHTLLFLVRRPRQLVTKRELLDVIWKDTFVTENALARVVAQLRKALGDDAKEARYIETVPTLGYRFVAPVQELKVVDPVPLSRRWVWTGLAAAAALALLLIPTSLEWHSPPIRSIAVLPLENLSADPEQAYFTDGMTDLLIARLAKVKALKVISSASVMTYGNPPRKPLSEIARELDVDAVIQGSVLRAGERVRITVNLVHAASTETLWAESYEGDRDDVLSLQSEVARAIAREIEVEIGSEESTLLSRAPSVDPEALDHYFRGRFQMSEARAGRFERALELFDHALERDSGFALAYSAKAECIFDLGAHGQIRPLDALQEARELNQKALELEPNLDDAHYLSGWLALSSWSWSEAERTFERAIELNPSSARAHEGYAWYLAAMGRHDEAIDHAHRAAVLNPLDLKTRAQLARFYYYRREYDRGIAEARKVLAIDPDFVLAHTLLEWIHAQRGDYELALAAKKEELRGLGASQEELASLEEAYARSGVRGYWTWKLDYLRSGDYYRSYAHEVQAGHYMKVGELDRAFELLEQAHSEREFFLFMLDVNPWWDPVRSDPRFQEIARRLDFPSRG